MFVCVAHRESIFPFHTHIYKRTQDQHHHQPQFICVQTFHSISQTSPSSSSYLETSHNNNNLPYQCNGCKNSLCVCIQNENKHNKHPWICGSGSSSSYHMKHTWNHKSFFLLLLFLSFQALSFFVSGSDSFSLLNVNVIGFRVYNQKKRVKIFLNNLSIFEIIYLSSSSSG